MLHAFVHISNCADVEKLRVMMLAFVVSQFSYCLLVWIFHDRSVNKKINKIHERAFRIAYKDSCLNFEELLTKANTASIYNKNLQLLATEIFKPQRSLNPSFMNQVLRRKILHAAIVVAEIIWHQNQTRKGMELKMHVFLERRYGIQCHLP